MGIGKKIDGGGNTTSTVIPNNIPLLDKLKNVGGIPYSNTQNDKIKIDARRITATDGATITLIRQSSAPVIYYMGYEDMPTDITTDRYDKEHGWITVLGMSSGAVQFLPEGTNTLKRPIEYGSVDSTYGKVYFAKLRVSDDYGMGAVYGINIFINNDPIEYPLLRCRYTLQSPISSEVFDNIIDQLTVPVQFDRNWSGDNFRGYSSIALEYTGYSTTDKVIRTRFKHDNIIHSLKDRKGPTAKSEKIPIGLYLNGYYLANVDANFDFAPMKFDDIVCGNDKINTMTNIHDVNFTYVDSLTTIMSKISKMNANIKYLNKKIGS